MSNKQETVILQTVVTPQERDEIDAAAGLVHRSRSQFLKLAALERVKRINAEKANAESLESAIQG